MKFRVRVDLPFSNQKDADAIIGRLAEVIAKASNINEGSTNEESAYIEYVLCGHDEDKPCTSVLKLGVADKKLVTISLEE